MKVYAAVNESHDGIENIFLFVSEKLAEKFVKLENRLAMFKKYEVRVFNVAESLADAGWEGGRKTS